MTIRELLFPGRVIRELREDIEDLKRRAVEDRVRELEERVRSLEARGPFYVQPFVTVPYVQDVTPRVTWTDCTNNAPATAGNVFRINGDDSAGAVPA